MKEQTTLSQAIKDFVRGMGQALDLGATLHQSEESPLSSQADAIGSHWNRVGDYIRRAGQSIENEAGSKPPAQF